MNIEGSEVNERNYLSVCFSAFKKLFGQTMFSRYSNLSISNGIVLTAD